MARRKERPAKGGGRRTRRLPVALLVILAICVLFVAHANEFRFTQDDAYISLRYARNLVDGHGLVFNPGERVEGYSNFSWTVLLALLIELGSPPVETSQWLGILFGVGTVFFAARFTRALEGRWGPASVLAAALVAGTSAFALWSTGGLETAMFAFLVIAGLERGLAPGVGRAGRVAAPLLLCLAALTRPDGPLVFALWFAVRACDTLLDTGPANDGGRRALARDALLFVAPLVPYALWKLAYYGDLLPNTYYAKTGASPEYLSRGFDYAWKYFSAYGAWGLAPALGLLGAVRYGARSVEARLLLVWAGFAAYIVLIGGDVLYVHRFWLPILPIGAVLVARGVLVVAGRAAAPQGAKRVVLGVAVSLGAVLVGSGLARNWASIDSRRQTEIGFVLNMTQTGRWLGAHFPAGGRIAITTVGAVSYYSGLDVIDMLGLTDREIARNPKPIDGIFDTWREIKYNAESVLSRRPDMILFSTGVRPSAAAEKALFLYEDFYRSYFAYYFRSLPNRSHAQVGFGLRPDAPPFDAKRLELSDYGFLEDYSEGHLVQTRQGDYRAAADLFKRSYERSGGRFPWAKEWEGAARYDGGLGGGLEILQEVARDDPYSMVALVRTADHALRDSDAETAARRFDRAIEIDPDDAVGWMGQSVAAALSGDYERAFQFALEGIKRWDTGEMNLMQFGELALRTNRPDMAENAYRRVLLMNPSHADARRGLEAVGAVRRGATLPSGKDPRQPMKEGGTP